MRHLRWPTSLRRWHVLIRLYSTMGQTPTFAFLDISLHLRGTPSLYILSAVTIGCCGLGRAHACLTRFTSVYIACRLLALVEGSY